MHGYTGKLLRVNLTESRVTDEALNMEWAKDYIGSRGLGAKYLLEEIDPKIDALSPDNKLIFATGPLTGTMAPAGGRYMVVTKSPLTGGIANSNSGGTWGAELKYAGYDMIIVEGKAKNPVYLWIYNDTVEIKDASELWGMDTMETERHIQSKINEKAKVACIGPAGEKLIKFACIMNDMGRAAGRSGVGAVMGSKNLKAIAVRGTKGIKVADKGGFLKSVDAVMNFLDNDITKHFSQYGTPGVLAWINACGAIPTRNFQEGVYEDADKIDGTVLAEKISIRGARGKACFGCPVACGRMSRVSNEKYAGEGEGPEYETMGAFGSACSINDLEVITKANFICNEMGIDTISAGMTLACAMELVEKGYLSVEEIGADLRFGNKDAMLEMLKKMIARDGFGDILAEGSYRMAEKYGHPELSMSTKKQEYACYDPRATKGMGIQYATESRGGDHIRGEVQDIDLYNVYTWNIVTKRNIKYVDRYTTDDKPILTKEVQDWFSTFDCTGMCNFIFFLGVNEDLLYDLLETATGVGYKSTEDMLKCGERSFNTERIFNLAAGLTMKDDVIPPRMTGTPMPDGPAKGQIVEMDLMMPEYYKIRGWDEYGVPTMEKLDELGLHVYKPSLKA